VRALFLILLLFFISAPAYADCANPARPVGTAIYNTTTQQFQYCDGTDWVAMHPPGSGSGGCANPARAEGRMIYNPPQRVLQGCAGNVWKAMGPIGGGTQSKWAQISAGQSHSCAIKSDGTLWCWGGDASGELGNGATTGDQTSPNQESTLATDWASVSAGEGATCATKINGTLWCWGADSYGKLGNGATAGDQISPSQESTLATDWASVSTGNWHTCATKTDSTLWCWGRDNNGQLGNGATAGDQISPSQESTAATDWASVSAGASFA